MIEQVELERNKSKRKLIGKEKKKEIVGFFRNLGWKLEMARAQTRAKYRNPSREDLSEAENLVEEFHGRPSRYVEDIEESETYYDTLAILGELLELGVITDFTLELYENPPYDTGEEEIVLPFDNINIKFKGKNIPQVGCDPEGNCLEIVKGDQDLKISNKNQKLFLGFLWKIVYFTDKHHLEGPKAQSKGFEYEHHFAEESLKNKMIQTKNLPKLVYDVVNKKLELVGGTYKVTPEGIAD